MDLKKYHKKIDRLDAESKLIAEQEAKILLKKKVFDSSLKMMFGIELNNEDLENLKILETHPDEHLLAYLLYTNFKDSK